MTKDQFEKIIKNQVDMNLKEKGLSGIYLLSHIAKHNLYIFKIESEAKEVLINVEFE